MRISELSEKYGIDRRELDYFTNLGLVKSTKDDKNGYRDYGEDAEEDVKKILIATSMGAGGKQMKILVESFGTGLLNYEPYKEMVKGKIEEERAKVTKQFDMALQYLEELAKGE